MMHAALTEAKQREGEAAKHKAMVDKLSGDLEVAKREQEMMLNAVND